MSADTSKDIVQGILEKSPSESITKSLLIRKGIIPEIQIYLSEESIDQVNEIIQKFFRKELVSQIKWDFDVFQWSIPQLIGISFCIFMDFHAMKFLNISSSEKFIGFLADVEHHYLDNPYHSFLHAVDVLEFMYYLLLDFEVTKFLDHDDVLICLLSSLCHDVGHPGLNNAFQVNAKTLLAEQYAGLSVLENYSVDLTISIVKRHNLIFELVTSKYTSGIKSAILSTDMSFHFRLLDDLNSVGEVIQDSDSALNPEDRQILVNALVHASDISNPCRNWSLSRKWSDLVLLEFFDQGDLENELNLPPTPNMDRRETNQCQFSISFHDYIVRPFYISLTRVFPMMAKLVEHLTKNREQWYQIELNNYILATKSSNPDIPCSSLAKTSDSHLDINFVSNDNIEAETSPEIPIGVYVVTNGQNRNSDVSDYSNNQNKDSSSRNSKKSSLDARTCQSNDDTLRDVVSNLSLDDDKELDSNRDIQFSTKSVPFISTNSASSPTAPKLNKLFVSSPKPGFTATGAGRRLSIAAGVVIIPDNFIFAWDSSNDGLQANMSNKSSKMRSSRTSSFNNRSGSSDTLTDPSTQTKSGPSASAPAGPALETLTQQIMRHSRSLDKGAMDAILDQSDEYEHKRKSLLQDDLSNMELKDKQDLMTRWNETLSQTTVAKAKAINSPAIMDNNLSSSLDSNQANSPSQQAGNSGNRKKRSSNSKMARKSSSLSKFVESLDEELHLEPMPRLPASVSSKQQSPVSPSSTGSSNSK